MSLLVATQVTAVATAVLAAFAIVTEYAKVDVLPPNHRESLDWAEPSPAVNWPAVIPVDIAITFTDRNGPRWSVGRMASYAPRDRGTSGTGPARWDTIPHG
jgi:hypothetical protein